MNKINSDNKEDNPRPAVGQELYTAVRSCVWLPFPQNDSMEWNLWDREF